jgi:octaprenyl-diphosphate synthase
MSEGELLQIEKARKLDIDEATYFSIISDKTASLIAACTSCGAHSAGVDDSTRAAMNRFGQELGMAFQIRDDLFDFGVKDVGKPLGIDLQEKKMTLPLIHALSASDAAERKRIMRIVRQKKKSRTDVETVAAFVQQAGGIDYARRTMHDYADRALAELETLPATDAREALADLVRYTITREK